jgi:hypothetical protein
MKYLVFALALLGAAITGASAQGATPDLKGTWTGGTASDSSRGDGPAERPKPLWWGFDIQGREEQIEYELSSSRPKSTLRLWQICR